MERLTDRNKEIPTPCSDNALFWARVHEKLARYEDAEEQGRLIVLPCKVGDTVYWVPGFFNGSPILSARVAGFTYQSKNELRLELPDLDIEPIYPNAHLFFSREEAEKALEVKS